MRGTHQKSPGTGRGYFGSGSKRPLICLSLSTGYKAARLNLEKAQIEFNEQKNKLCLDVVNQFLTYSLNVKLLEIQDSQFNLVSKQFQAVSRDFYQGMKTKKDFLRFKTQVSRNEIDLIKTNYY